jgi:pyruvate/2-oxoglutarate dehydrogenase complex dihydrolipoamide acyltransferase (E2) component
MIRIVSKRNGFRRSGIAHPDTPVDYPDDHFSPEALKVLKSEPMLVVSELPDPEEEESTSEEKEPAIVYASSAARKRAIELGLDLASITGTGHNHIITKADVERAAD